MLHHSEPSSKCVKHPTKNAKALTKQFGISMRSLYNVLDGTNWGGDYSS